MRAFPIPSHRIAVPILLAMLSGCTGLAPRQQAEQSWEQHQAQLLELHDWTLRARIGLKRQGEAASATLDWRQQQQDYQLLLIAPLGKGTVELSARDGVVNLRTNDNQSFSADSPEALLRQHLGWHLPVDGLPYWIRGLPQPGAPVDALILDKRQRLIQLQQSGWDISYGGYRQVADYVLPGKVRLEHNDIRIKLAVTEWTLENDDRLLARPR
ncbi:MAG: lipoprotein insertase outer membrane protein LolB [Gammaproteobacteria bacterium]